MMSQLNFIIWFVTAVALSSRQSRQVWVYDGYPQLRNRAAIVKLILSASTID